MDEQALIALAGALVLVGVHLSSGRLRFLEGVPRSRWLSAAGGISVAYVFVHLLPELAEGQAAIEGDGEEGGRPLVGWLEHHVWLMGLVGVVVFYGVEKHSLTSRRTWRAATGEGRTADDAFWLSIASFAAYNAIVGYLLLREELDDVSQLVLYVAALGVHFVINDFSLRDHHRDAYDFLGRWLISLAVLAGWVLGVTTEISERAIALVLAFIGGGVVLNVLKEELPGERQARFVPFVIGAALYTVVLQII